ncbi:MAG: Gfo/Idh/MocA family oxidoreductase [Hyphomicrobiales bacterium]|nr:Gfo/Idh/MocA family oxidoreductase [Hyphomicrobiales bacterium]MDE2114727.1 Gfo/Idh/MocA family oxidoreductase [Hyphomicrobiales bacterium]
MPNPTRIAVQGAGLIGARHIQHILADPAAALHAIIDPSPAAQALAARSQTPWFPDLSAMLAAGRPEGIIIATPNHLHLANGLEAIAAGLPTLMEKPLAATVFDGQKLVDAANRARVPLLTGHHRRHNPMVQKAKATLESGQLGTLVAVHAFFWLFKPEDYFDMAWRREQGAGPVLVNMIHDVDLLRHFCGDVASVQAMDSSAIRGHTVEDTCTILLRFKNGILGTVSVSDTIVAPWSWELTTGENPDFPRQNQPCIFIGGTHGALTIPDLALTQAENKRSWLEPLTRSAIAYAPQDPLVSQDPLVLQIQQFCRVIRNGEKPLVSGEEGLKTLRVIEAVKTAAASGETVRL